MKFSIAALLCALSVGTANAEPFDLRGIRLGITLAEFRSMTVPDGGDAKLLCRGDAEAKGGHGLTGLLVDIEGGSVACGFFKRGERLLPEVYKWFDANMRVATVGAYVRF